MKMKFALLCGMAAALTFSSIANAGYFVRPTAGYGTRDLDGNFIDGVGEFIDGYIGNGATSNDVGHWDATRSIWSSVDLERGELKSYAESNAGNVAAYGNAIMGETVTIRNGAGTTWNFGLALDGYFDAYTGPVAPGNDPGLLYYDLAVFVYRPGQANYEQWFYPDEFYPNGNPIGVDPVFQGYIRNTFAVNANEDGYQHFPIFEEILGSIELESDYEQFEFYAKIFVGGSPNTAGGLEGFYAGFDNTAHISLDFEDGVDAYSDSGKFLGLRQDPGQPPVNQVPLPGAFGLMLLGLAGGAAMRRHKKA